MQQFVERQMKQAIQPLNNLYKQPLLSLRTCAAQAQAIGHVGSYVYVYVYNYVCVLFNVYM